jgi:ABC-type amino acid transport substrate-binding protein
MMSRNQRGGERMSSSVKWLSNQTYELFEQYSEGNFDRITLNRLVLEATEKAKEMEKELTIRFALFYAYGQDNVSEQLRTKIEKWYDKIYEGGEQ